MTSRLSRVARLTETVGRHQRDRRAVVASIRRYEMMLMVQESVPIDEIVDLSREIHASRDGAAFERVREIMAEVEARWEAGERPGGRDRAADAQVDEERRINRRRLDHLR